MHKLQRVTWAAAIPLFVLLTGLLAGCVDLGAIRAFGKTSAATAEYKQIGTDFAKEPIRRKRYEPSSRHTDLDTAAKKRAEVATRFEGAQAILVAYMDALADLAADDLPSIDKQVDAFGKALESAKFVGEGDKQIGKSTATAASSIAKVLGRVLIDQWRQAQLAKLINETDDALQVAVSGLREVVMFDFNASLDVEKEAVRKYFEAPIAAARSRKPVDEDMVPPLARFLMADLNDDIEARRDKLQKYADVLAKIGTGHAELKKNVGKLDDAALSARLQQYVKDLVTLYKAISG